MKKLLSSLLCLSLGVLALSQDLSRPVTYRTVAIPLHTALDELSKQSKVKLFASEALADEPVILALKSVPAQEAMDRIAEAAGADWQKRPGGEYMLVRTPELAEKLTKNAPDYREKEIRKALERLGKSENAEDYTDAGLARTAQSLAGAFTVIENNPMTKKGMVDTRPAQSVIERSPSHHALIKLLPLLEIRRLAEMEPGDKLVLSTQPNSMQLELPAGAGDTLDEFIRAQGLFAAAFEKAHPKPPDGFERYFKSYYSPVPEGKVKLILIVERSQFASIPPLIRFFAVSEAGSVVGFATQGLSVNSINDYETAQHLLKVQAKKEVLIPLSDDSKLIDAAYRIMEQKGDGAVELTPRLRELLLDPANHDPLSFCVSDGFLALADARQANLVACPTDTMVDLNFSGSEDHEFKLGYFQSVLPRRGVNCKVADGWVVAGPEDPVDEWRRRTNRDLLGVCLSEGDERGCVSLESAGRLALSARADRESDLSNFYWVLGAQYAPFQQRDPQLLRFYFSLSEAQLARLASGERLRFGDLSKSQWLRLEEVIYPKVLLRPALEFEAPHWGENGDSGQHYLVEEKTEFLPEGLPENGSFSLRCEDKELLFAELADGDYRLILETTLSSVAQTVAERQAGLLERDPKQDEYKGFHRLNEVHWLAPGRSRDLAFRFDFSNDRAASGRLREVVRGKERWNLDNLPPNLKQQYEQELKQARARVAEGQHSIEKPAVKPPA